MKRTNRSTNPAWLPAGTYLGLALIVGVVSALIFWWTPKQDVYISGPQSVPAVLVDIHTGKLVYTRTGLYGSVEKPRFRPSAAKFTGSLVVLPSFGGSSAYETGLELPLSADEPTQPGEKAIFFNKDYTAFCFGPVLIEDWYATDIGQYYIIAPIENGATPQSVLDDIPDAPDLTDLLTASPIALGKFSPDSDGAELTVVNCGEETYNFGRFYLLEQYSYNEDLDCVEWTPLEYVIDKDMVAWTTEALPVEPGQQRTLSFDWLWLYGTLPEGNYRLVTYASPQSDPDRNVTVSVQFPVR